MRRFLATGAAVVAGLVLLAAGLTYGYLRRSLPRVDGTVHVVGTDGAIDIVRDADAIPHIFATTKRDALFGLGYVHAQDRLWQMEFQRRVGFGRLSEIFGEVTLPQDRFLRTVGFGRAARETWAALPGWAQSQVNAYIAGINAFIATHHGSQLPPEFTLLRFAPEPWTGPDVIVWVKMMAWDLSKNYSFELLRSDLLRQVGAEKATRLLPPYAEDGLSILTARDLDWLRPAPAATAAEPGGGTSGHAGDGAFGAVMAALSQGNPAAARLLFGNATGDAIGSNNWVVDGTMTASGYPMLANDPHLDAHIPSIWYLAHMTAGDFDVIGATLPGAPAVAIGRNRRIAWGETNVGADVEDLYREHLDPTGTKAEFRGAFEPLRIVHETIPVKGGAAAQLDVQLTRHGPIVSDALNFLAATAAARKHQPPPPALAPLAFRWTALDPGDTTIVAFLRLNEARNWGDFTNALRDFIVPAQNFVYADVDGHIGYYAPGHIPIRAQGDGAVPADGAAGDAEWTGWIPFDQLPHVFDPPEHFIVTANNRSAPPVYPYVIATEFTEPFRAGRIASLLRGRTKLTPDDFAAIQADKFSSSAAELVPLLLARAHPTTTADGQAVSLVRDWNHVAAGDSAATAIFEAWVTKLPAAIVGDELGPQLTDDYVKGDRRSFVTRFLVKTLQDPDDPWCDDVRTPQRESCGDIVTGALHAAVADLSTRLGGDLTRWRWSAVHPAMFPHEGLDAVALLRPLLSRSVPGAGDWSTVDVGAVSAADPYEQHEVPSYRQIVDLSPRNASRFLDAVGESGHFLSKHYADFLPDWRAVRYRPMRTKREDIERGATGTLKLVPR